MTEPKRSIRLSRGQKIVRNLLLAVLAGFLVWVNARAPLPPELAFRRVQRENFLTPYAQFLGVCEADDFRWGVGLTDRWLVFGELDSHQLELWPLEGDGPMVVPAPGRYSRGVEELGFVAVNAPEGTASARLAATVSCWYTHTDTGTHSTWSYWASEDQDWEGLTPTYWENTYVLEGEPLAEGAFFFRLPKLEHSENQTIEFYARGHLADWSLYLSQVYQEDPGRRDAACTLTAVFFDDQGRALGQAELTDAGGG